MLSLRMILKIKHHFHLLKNLNLGVCDSSLSGSYKCGLGAWQLSQNTQHPCILQPLGGLNESLKQAPCSIPMKTHFFNLHVFTTTTFHYHLNSQPQHGTPLYFDTEGYMHAPTSQPHMGPFQPLHHSIFQHKSAWVNLGRPIG